MDENLRTQIENSQSQLSLLIRRGCELRDGLSADPSDNSVIAGTRAWQEECGVVVNQLSGGSKAHWLARAFSQAFLMRSLDGRAVEGVPPAEIVSRLIGVLEQAVASLSQIKDRPDVSAPSTPPAPHRFDFVHDEQIRPILERAYADSQQAFEQGDYEQALQTACGTLEAIVTDALEHKGIAGLGRAASGDSIRGKKIADWSFNTRLAVAEKAGLIRGGCARLPAIARAYRESTSENESGSRAKTVVSELDARVTGQVLHVIMRDLDPGR